MSKWGLHIYQKIIIVFIGLIGPVYAISVFINIQGSDYVQNEISKSVRLNTSFYSKQLNSQFEYIKIQQQLFINDSSLQNLIFISDLLESFDNVSYVNNIKERLAVIRNSSSYIKNTGVILNSLNRTISFQNGIMDNPNPEYNLILKCLSEQKSGNSMYYINGRIFMMEFFPLMTKNYNDAKVISYIEFDKENITRYISQMLITKNSGTFLMNENLNVLASSENNKLIFENLSKQDELHRMEKSDPVEFITKIGGNNYWIACSKLNIPNMILISYMPEKEITGPLGKYKIWFILLSVVSIIVIIIFSFSVNLMIHRPMSRFVDALKKVETDNLDICINHSGRDEFGYIYKGFNNMVMRLKNSIRQNYEQKIALHQSELKQLQTQINPHFLYNSFFSVYRMCKCGDYDNVAHLTQKLGSYYQFITRSGSEEVPLEMEFKHAMDYVEIQSIRFSQRIKVYTVEIPEECKNIMVPRIILQPVIENAFEHAFENRISGGNIYIGLSYESQTLSITVEDDGDPIHDTALTNLQTKLHDTLNVKEKTGIINVCRRIKLKYGNQSGLTVERSMYGGLKFTIKINYKGGMDNV